MSFIAPELDFEPLFGSEDEGTILNRMIDDANEGLDPVADSDEWVDTREGSHWRTCVMPVVRELARLYDFAGTEVPMSGFVLWAWETYLDDLGAVYEVNRLAATPATVTLTFSNSGASAQPISGGTTVSVVPSTPDDPAPEFEVTTGGSAPAGGSVDLPAQATEPGRAGDVSALAITAPSTPLPPGVTVTNAAPSIGGTDVESDDAYRIRILQAIAGKGPGAVADYVRWAGGWPGVGRVTVVPVWNGASTVLVMISDPNGQPLPSAVVTALQQDLDPVPGTGAGTAPVGANVTVDTSTLLNLAMAATITYKAGFTWDGAAGTTAVGAAITAAITRYLLTVPPGGTVRLAHIAGIIATWPGVENVSAVTIDPGTGPAAADVAVSLTPPKVPVLTTFTAS